MKKKKKNTIRIFLIFQYIHFYFDKFKTTSNTDVKSYHIRKLQYFLNTFFNAHFLSVFVVIQLACLLEKFSVMCRKFFTQ